MLADLLARIGTLAWLAVALVAAVIEISIPHFGFAFVGAGAVAAAVAAYFGFDLTTQFAVLVIVLVASLALLRSRLVGLFGGARGVPSRTATLVGRSGIVTHDIDPTVGTGRVNVGGEDWAARSTAPIAAGAKVRVVGADGIVLEVTVWMEG
jgi:membrane protein implicated in regulation of membrane protease activity